MGGLAGMPDAESVFVFGGKGGIGEVLAGDGEIFRREAAAQRIAGIHRA